MSPYRNRLKSPEEVELERKRAELARLQERLAEREQFYSAFRGEIREFELLYDEVLGSRITVLDDLEWQLDGLLGKSAPEKVTVQQHKWDADQSFKHYSDLLDEATGPEPDIYGKNLKNLYREVAKAIHPDLAGDDADRMRRQELMAAANQAYQAGDRSLLESLLSDREVEPDDTATHDVAQLLVKVIRQIAQVKQNISVVNRKIEELKVSDIYIFKQRVDEAMADGIDLLAEMAAKVKQKIAKARKRLSALRGSAGLEQEDHDHHTPLETRVIRFPADRSCGTLYERNRGSSDFRDWQRLGNAKGVKEVQLNKDVRLDMKETAGREIHFIDTLQPDDLQALYLYEIDDSALLHLEHLTGLQELYLSNSSVTDQGLQLLEKLHGMTRLYIYHTAISDAGLDNLQRLKWLKLLTCSGTSITEEGLSRFRKAMPGCKAVNFKWRFEK